MSYDLFDFMVTQRIALARYREWRAPLNSDSGFYADLLQLHDLQAPRTTRDYENYIARLADVPRYFRENIANMRQGIADGFVLPADDHSGHRERDRRRPVSRKPRIRRSGCRLRSSRPACRRPTARGSRRRASAAIEGQVIPAYAEFKAFFDDEYRPAARKSIGATDLPDGKAYYADLVRYFTTLPDATAEKIHATGLAEVARIRAEMEAIVQRGRVPGQLRRSSSCSCAPTRSSTRRRRSRLLRTPRGSRARSTAACRISSASFPRAPYTVKPVPAALAPNYTGGRYNPGPLGAAGEYWVNTYALQNRPLYVLPALTLHEAAPGHHTQGRARARARERARRSGRNFYPHAFGEGWGLYSEYLGVEMGVYHTPYERFGRLTYEMWRACRLVVDTGMHAFGWSRQKRARLHEVEHGAVRARDPHRDRPLHRLARPGARLQDGRAARSRRCASAPRGSSATRFDVRAFHDAVLGTGRRDAAGPREAGRRVHRARARLVNAHGEYGRLLGPEGPLARVIDGLRIAPRAAAHGGLGRRDARGARHCSRSRRAPAPARPSPTSCRRCCPAGRSIISTGTRTLQDQLFNRDLPTVARALGRPARIALLKGRANYLCLHRLELAESMPPLPGIPAPNARMLARDPTLVARDDDRRPRRSRGPARQRSGAREP